MNPLRTIECPRQHITRIRLINRSIFDSANRRSAWHGTIKIESEKLRSNIFDNVERKNSFEVEEVGRKMSAIWNHANLFLNSSRYDLDQRESSQNIFDSNLESIRCDSNLQNFCAELVQLRNYLCTLNF